jgi:hypothetical protein
MKFSPALAAVLFMPAAVGLLYQAVQPHPWPHRLLAIALLLAIFEQAHMARVDLRNVEVISQRLGDPRLKPFSRIVIWTVVGQLVGFYGAAVGYLGWGMATIMLSVIGFNLTATCAWSQRVPSPFRRGLAIAPDCTDPRRDRPQSCRPVDHPALSKRGSGGHVCNHRSLQRQ